MAHVRVAIHALLERVVAGVGDAVVSDNALHVAEPDLTTRALVRLVLVDFGVVSLESGPRDVAAGRGQSDQSHKTWQEHECER